MKLRIRIRVLEGRAWWALERADTGEVLLLCASYRSAARLLREAA